MTGPKCGEIFDDTVTLHVYLLLCFTEERKAQSDINRVIYSSLHARLLFFMLYKRE